MDGRKISKQESKDSARLFKSSNDYNTPLASEVEREELRGRHSSKAASAFDAVCSSRTKQRYGR